MSRRRRGAGPGGSVELGGHRHPVQGAQVAVVRADGRVLMQLRPWPPGWELPGGRIDSGEEAAACAAREVREETGLEVAVRGLAGVYSWTGLRRGADAVLWGEVVGGAPRRSLEQLSLRWFSPQRLPRNVFPWLPARIADAVAAARGAPPQLRTQRIGVVHVLFFGTASLAQLADLLRRARRRARGGRGGG